MHAPFPSRAAIDIAASNLALKARQRGVAINRLEFVTTSEPWDTSLGVLISYDTDAELERRNADGTSDALKNEFKDELERSGSVLRFERMPENISFDFESHENVIRNYHGSYFLRLR